MNTIKEELKKQVEARFESSIFVENVCVSYRHDYGAIDHKERLKLQFECKEYMRAILNNWDSFYLYPDSKNKREIPTRCTCSKEEATGETLINGVWRCNLCGMPKEEILLKCEHCGMSLFKKKKDTNKSVSKVEFAIAALGVSSFIGIFISLGMAMYGGVALPWEYLCMISCWSVYLLLMLIDKVLFGKQKEQS